MALIVCRGPYRWTYRCIVAWSNKGRSRWKRNDSSKWLLDIMADIMADSPCMGLPLVTLTNQMLADVEEWVRIFGVLGLVL